MSRPLEGLRVLDFTHVLAGPFCTRVLADMGADVVKVGSSAKSGASSESGHPYYVMWNRNKRSLALDMSRDEAREICAGLCDRADIVIDNFSVGVLDRWGVGYEATRERNPGVIYVQMSGMGDSGPWSKFVTYAPTIHAIAGLTHLTGVEGRRDIGIGFSYNDHVAGLHAAVVILAALEARRRTGRGQRVEVSQFEIGVNLAGPALLDLFANGRKAMPAGNRLPYDLAAPHGCYPCAGAGSDAVADERWVAIACMTDAQWEALKRVMGNPEWAEAPELAAAAGRVAALERVDRGVAEWTRERDAGEIMAECQAAGVPAGIVQNGVDMAENDPQLARYGFLVDLGDDHPQIGQSYADRLPIRFHGTPCDEYRRSAVLGEHNEAVLRDWLGLSAAEVREGEKSGLLS